MLQLLEEVGSSTASGGLFSNSAISSHLRALGYPELSISSMEHCGTETGLGMLRDCGGCTPSLVMLKHRCNLRTCAYCAKSRMRRIRKLYLPHLNSVDKADRSLFLSFLTISPANFQDLKTGIVSIRHSFNKFIRTKYIKDRIKGGIYVIEAKKSGDLWNIHIHAIIYSKYLDNRLRGSCNNCNQNLIKCDGQLGKRIFYCANKKCNSTDVILKGDSTIVSMFSKISGKPCNVHISRLNSTIHTLNYLLKYVMSNKENFDSAYTAAVYINTMRKCKLINKFGVFYGIKIEKTKVYCNECDGLINYVFDVQITKLMIEYKDKVFTKTARVWSYFQQSFFKCYCCSEIETMLCEDDKYRCVNHLNV